MFQRLQQKWKVNGLHLVLILCTFAVGGSLTGFVGRKLMNFIPLEQSWLWIVVYILMVTILWPFAVLLVSIPFGQYRFFTGYLKKMGKRIGVGSNKQDQELQTSGNGQRTTGNGHQVIRIAIFASGAGSNAQKIIDHFRNSDDIKIALIVCNKPGAGVLAIAAKENIPSLLIDKEKFFRQDGYMDELQKAGIGFIVLAGFLWKIPGTLIHAYSGKIINIHPALLPNYGGKGMYGNHVHEAVISAGEKESGITIHYVDGHYDNGDIILQVRCPVSENDTPATLANRIHQLEHEHYPQVIEKIVSKEIKEKKR
ncbi:MAG TPA: phosphoribosylglycinamide formyltransferase [Chitinophagaceae bacterium]|nr:phosphoribosylglycinamide formyltransferase [Chitinophagaceae bacterium]